MTTDSQLQYQLHISEPIPFSRPETAPNGERQMFQYIATTLISGAQDAVLVDPPMTTEQTAQVINWVEASGKTLKHIFHYSRPRRPLVWHGPATRAFSRRHGLRRSGHDRGNALSRLTRGPGGRVGQNVP